jgi:hypothetical protein
LATCKRLDRQNNLSINKAGWHAVADAVRNQRDV